MVPSLALLLAAISAPARAQLVTQAVDLPGRRESRPCDYASCAIGIAPRWNGLALVRGTTGQQVANLNFFWPRDVAGALRVAGGRVASADSTEVAARRALRLRRVGAALTDATVGALRAGRVRSAHGAVAAVGLAALGLSIPIQFAADAALSRAVWWHNLRFAR